MEVIKAKDFGKLDFTKNILTQDISYLVKYIINTYNGIILPINGNECLTYRDGNLIKLFYKKIKNTSINDPYRMAVSYLNKEDGCR